MSASAEPDPTQDLLGYLVRAYHRERAGQPEPETGTVHGVPGSPGLSVQAFVTWARAWLQKNPVVATYPVARGLGLRFQDGSGVPFTEQQPERFRNEVIHITNPGFNSATDLIASPECMPITGRTT